MAFPDDTTTFLRAVDPSTQSDLNNIATYQNYLANGDFATAKEFLNSLSNGIQMNLNASRFNQVLEEVEQIEKFYLGLNGVREYIQSNINAFSDIGIWSADANYRVGNITSYNETLYVCKKDNKGIAPSGASADEYWGVFIKNQKQYPIAKEQPTGLAAGDLWFQEIEQ